MIFIPDLLCSHPPGRAFYPPKSNIFAMISSGWIHNTSRLSHNLIYWHLNYVMAHRIQSYGGREDYECSYTILTCSTHASSSLPERDALNTRTLLFSSGNTAGFNWQRASSLPWVHTQFNMILHRN